MTERVKIEDVDAALKSVEETMQFFSVYLESYSANEKKFRDLEELMQIAVRYVQEMKQGYEMELAALRTAGSEDSGDETELQRCQENIHKYAEQLNELAKYYVECNKYMSDEASRYKSSEEIAANGTLLARKCTRLLELIKNSR